MLADARERRDVFERRVADGLHATEVGEQASTPRRAHAGDAVERTRGERLAATRALVATGEAVRFVTHAHEQAQCGVIRCEHQGIFVAKAHDALVAALAASGPGLGQPHHRRHGEAQLAEGRGGSLELAASAVDQQQVRERTQVLARCEATPHDFAHASVVVAARRLADREVAVGRAIGHAPHQHRHPRHGIGPSQVRQVVALDALGRASELEDLGQALERTARGAGLLAVLFQRLLRMTLGQIEQLVTRPATGHGDVHRSPPPLCEKLAQALDVVGQLFHEDLGRHDLAACVELAEEGAQHVAPRKRRALGPSPRRHHVAIAHVDDGDHRDPAGRGHGDHVAVLAVGAHDLLARERTFQGVGAIAQHRCFLELEALRRSMHLAAQLVEQPVVAPTQHGNRPVDERLVGRLVDQVHARRRAAPDLVVEAGARAFLQLAVAARPQRKQRAQEPQRAAYRLGAGEGAEVERLVALDLAHQRQAREGMATIHAHQEVRLVVLEPQVVGRLLLLDQRVLEKQRLFGGCRGHDGHVDGATHQQPHQMPTVTDTEVATYTAAQVGRLADVEHATVDVEPAIHAGPRRKLGDAALELVGRCRCGGHGP